METSLMRQNTFVLRIKLVLLQASILMNKLNPANASLRFLSLMDRNVCNAIFLAIGPLLQKLANLALKKCTSIP